MNFDINMNVFIIIAAFTLAALAICILAVIIIPKDSEASDKEFQLTTKNILEHVKALYDKGEYALVELLSIKYLERMPYHNDVRRYLAEAYCKENKYDSAIKQCFFILKRNPDDKRTRKVLGRCYIHKGLLHKAIREYESFFDSKSNDIDTMRTLAKLYKDTGQLYLAISVNNLIASIVKSESEIAEVNLILADLNEQVHNYPAAFDAYKNRLNIYPKDVETNKKLVELYVKLNNTAKAIETLLFMLSFVNEPRDLMWVYDSLIDLYVEIEEYEKAIEYSNKLLNVQGVDKFRVRNRIAEYNLKINNVETGIEILKELVMMSENDYEITTELAKAYIEQKEYEKALGLYNKLLDKSNQREAKNIRVLIGDLYVNWALEMASKGNYEAGFNNLDKAMSYNSLNPDIYYIKAIFNYDQKNYSACVGLINRAMEYDKSSNKNPKYLLKLSDVHHQLGNFFEEKKALSDLLKIDAKNPTGLYRLGLMYVVQHDMKNAEECFRKALSFDPNFLQAKYNLALIYEINNVEKAKVLYKEILEADPTFTEAENALADLYATEY